MKTVNLNIFKKAFTISILLIIIGGNMKIAHLKFSSFFLIIGLISSIFYIIAGIHEVYKSKKIDNSEKAMWIIGFTFMSFVTGLLYIFYGRKRIIP